MGYKPAQATVATAQSFATSFWQRTLEEAYELFQLPRLNVRSASYLNDMKNKLAAETAMLVKIRQMAMTMGGALSPRNPKAAEIEIAEQHMRSAEKMLGVEIPRDRKTAKARASTGHADVEAKRLAQVRATNAEIRERTYAELHAKANGLDPTKAM